MAPSEDVVPVSHATLAGTLWFFFYRPVTERARNRPIAAIATPRVTSRPTINTKAWG